MIALENPMTPITVITEQFDKTSTSSVRALIEKRAEEEGLDPVQVSAIARCESDYVWKAKNGSSSAESYFQFIDGTWKSTLKRMGYEENISKYDPELHIEAAIWLLKEDGTRHWNASKHCWDKPASAG